MNNVIVAGIDISRSRSILIQAPDNLSTEHILQLKKTLEKEFPETKFVFLSGDFKVIAESPKIKIHTIETQR